MMIAATAKTVTRLPVIRRGKRSGASGDFAFHGLWALSTATGEGAKATTFESLEDKKRVKVKNKVS